MLRFLTVVAALILGLIGLGMSLCGGGFLLAAAPSLSDWPWALLALGSIAIGVLLVWGAARLLRKGAKPPGADN